MGWVLLALLPATAAGIYFFGHRALVHMIVAVVSSVLAEAAVQKLRKVPATISDLSAALTGLLVAFNVPSAGPYWISAVGGVFAIIVVKQAFGGLGHNFMNPALAARAFLLAAWPVHMTSGWLAPAGTQSLSGVDAFTSSTPMAAIKSMRGFGNMDASYLQDALLPLFTGSVGGCIGETSALALLLGAAVLFAKRYIDFRIPVCYIGTVFLLTWVFNGTGSFFTREALLVPSFHILGGGLILGAFFMATDMVTRPITPVGAVVFGIGCGCLTVLIRLAGGYPEGVSYSILLMNIAAPLLDRIRRPRKYGQQKMTKKADA